MTRRGMAGSMIGAVAVAAALTTGIVQAQAPEAPQGATQPERRGPGGPGRHFGWGGPFERGFDGPMGLLRGLDLSDEQRTQIRDVLRGHQAEQQAIMEKVRAAHRAQDTAITAHPFDEQAVRAATADLAAVMADSAVLRARVHSDVFAVLTPDQQAKAAELKAQRQARMDQVRERVKERRQLRQQQRQQRRAQPGAL